MPLRRSSPTLVVAFFVFAAAGSGCADEAESPPAPPAMPNVASEPRVIVAAGPHQFHVEPHASGHVYAYAGATVVDPTTATVTIDVPIEGGTRPLELRWDERDRRYEGRLTGVTIIPGSLTVHLTIGEMVFVGTNVIVVVLPAVVVVHEGRGKYRHKHKHRGRH